MRFSAAFHEGSDALGGDAGFPELLAEIAGILLVGLNTGLSLVSLLWPFSRKHPRRVSSDRKRLLPNDPISSAPTNEPQPTPYGFCWIRTSATGICPRLFANCLRLIVRILWAGAPRTSRPKDSWTSMPFAQRCDGSARKRASGFICVETAASFWFGIQSGFEKTAWRSCTLSHFLWPPKALSVRGITDSHERGLARPPSYARLTYRCEGP